MNQHGLPDLGPAYVSENYTKLFEMSQYYGIYCKDGLSMMIGQHSKKQFNEWILLFQAKANELCAYNILRFMVDIWDAWGVDDVINIECVTYTTTKYFPYLDTEFYWEVTNLPSS